MIEQHRKPSSPSRAAFRRGLRHTVAVALLTLAGADAGAASLALTGTADDGARWFEYFSDAFAELGRDPDGFYAISGLPQVGNAFGTNVDVFPNDNAFDLGTITYNDAALTGVGHESAAVTDYTVDFDLNIADDDAVANSANDNRGYDTTVSGLQGAVEFTDNVVTSIDLSARITFTYRFGANSFPYEGTLVFDGDRFELLVDDTNTFGSSTFRYAWEAEGILDQVAVAPIAGDYDGDGVVDDDDYALWVSQFGGAGPDSDGNRDGVVD
ncbi:MAG: hypothetical protein AAF266_12690, partial [Planctomycetota bacterium]